MALFLDATYLPTRPNGQKEGVLVVWGYPTDGVVKFSCCQLESTPLNGVEKVSMTWVSMTRSAWRSSATAGE